MQHVNKARMGKLPVRKTLMPPLLALLCLAPTLAQAQTTPPPQAIKPPAAQQTPAGTAPSQDSQPSKDTTPSEEGAMLDSDPRLRQRVSLRLENVTLSKALAQLSATTHVPLLADGDQLQSKKISATFLDKPMRDVLDALAALGHYEWVGRKSGAFVLRAIPPVLVDPKLATWGKALRDSFTKMTPEQRQALSQPYGTSLSALPPDMQRAMQGALSAMPDPTGPDGRPIPMHETMLSNAGSLMVGFEVDHQEDGNNYYLSYSLPGYGGGTDLVGHD